MSAYVLRDRVRERLTRMREVEQAALVANRTATLDEMRSRQGLIHGLQVALDAIDEELREAH
jgi:hypothetical protein